MSSVNKTIQQKTSELTRMVEWFDSDSFELEAALDRFKEAEKLALEIEQDLMTIKNEIQIVKKKFDDKS